MTSGRAAGSAANGGVGVVREGFRFDEAALTRWMTENIEGFEGPMEVLQFKGGQSNPTYRLVTPGRSYVLRRKPTGKLAPGAHAIDREARVMSALGTHGYPVARVYGVCRDDAVIGSWFYVMEMVEGRIFWDAAFPEVPASDRRAYFSAMNRTLADLHGFDPRAIGLEDYGRQGDYFQRQISRWSKTYLADTDAGRDPGMDRLIDWLPGAIPPGDETSIVHGDFRCDNLIFDLEKPRVLAVLDWELSTLGHPLADFAYHALMYRIPPDIVAGIGDVDPRVLKVPTEEDYIAEYCANTGRSSIPNYDFYVAFNLFRLAAIFHGIKGRFIRGSASSEHAAARAQSFPRIVRLALEAMEACD
ncbi:MAG: phosphotransferase [Aquamicrobium sp.]|nr:phosphotransferase [Aquamicrobium sp.]